MRKLLIVVGAMGMLAGCGNEEAAQRAAERARFQAALDVMSEADLGYAPAPSPGQKPVELQAYRQGKLAEAVKQLKPLSTSGPATQQVAANRLLSEAHASAARYAAAQGTDAWTSLAPDSALAISYSIALDRANSRATAIHDDATDLIAHLREEQGQNQKRIDGLKPDIETLKGKVADLSGQVEALNKERDATLAQGRTLGDQAFQLEGQARFDRYQQSTDAERKGQVAGSQAQTLAAKADVYNSEAAILAKQLELAEAQAKSIDTQIKDAGDRQAASAKIRQEGVAGREDVSTKLQAQLKIIVSRFNDTVQKRFDESHEQMAAAIGAAESAVRQARAADDRRSAQGESVLLRVQSAGIYARHAVAAGGIGQTLGELAAVAERVLPAEQAKAYRDAADTVTAAQNKAIADGKQVIGDARAKATDLTQGGASDDPMVGVAKRQLEQLDAYSVDMDKTDLKAGTSIAAPVAAPAPAEAPADAPAEK